MSSAQPAAVARVANLRVSFPTPEGVVQALRLVSLELAPGEVLALVGESGSGKTVLGLSLLGLLPAVARPIVTGAVEVAGIDMLNASEKSRRAVQRHLLGAVFQDPLTSLNPFLTIGDQLMEPLLVHERISRAEARGRAVELLEKVGIPDAAHRLSDYPHRFSGGMRQRVMIAMALIGNPKVLIADEPTTALDATIQAQVLDLFRHIQTEFGISILLITHNLGIVAGMAERVAVMYAGRVVESAATAELFANPRHPYTLALLKAVPRMGNGAQALASIGGEPPDLARLRSGCSFYDRCSFREEKCKDQPPPLEPVSEGHFARCWVDITAPSSSRDR